MTDLSKVIPHLLLATSVPAFSLGYAQDAPEAAANPTVNCASRPGERIHCAADTTAGVALVRSTGESACLLGKTWGYDNAGIWVSDGCSGEFVVGHATPVPPEKEKQKSPEYVPNAGFL